MSEIDKPESWADRNKRINVEVRESLGEDTAEALLATREEQAALSRELDELSAWYTDAYDGEVMRAVGDGLNSVESQSQARLAVQAIDPEKFSRLREIEKLVHAHNAKSQVMQNAAHSSVIEANLRTRIIY